MNGNKSQLITSLNWKTFHPFFESFFSVNTVYPCSYEPAAVLCIPLLPIGFFYTLLSFLSIIFVCIIVGFSATLLFLKKASNHHQNTSHSDLQPSRSNPNDNIKTIKAYF